MNKHKLNDLIQKITLFSIFIIFILETTIGCKRQIKEITPEEVEFTEIDRTKYYPFQHPKNQGWIENIKKIQENHQAFFADFSLRIDRYHPKKETFYSDGKIYYSKNTNNLKIQLMDSFFGMVFSEILADKETIKIKSSKDEAIKSQPMGDILLFDPSKNKDITIPFPVIYYFIQGNFFDDFSKNPTYLSPEERKVIVNRGSDRFIYYFSENFLQSIEWKSPYQNTSAIAKLVGKPTFPPNHLVTKILEDGRDKEVMMIVIQLKNIQRKEPNPSFLKIQ